MLEVSVSVLKMVHVWWSDGGVISGKQVWPSCSDLGGAGQPDPATMGCEHGDPQTVG